MEETTQNTSNGGSDNGGQNGRGANGVGQNPSAQPPNFKDNDGNEITIWGKRLAGILLILCTLLSAFYLIGHWPDQLAKPKDSIKPLYTYEWFNVRLVGIPDTGRIRYFNDSLIVVEEAGLVNIKQQKRDTLTIPANSQQKDIDSLRRFNDSLRKVWASADSLTRSQFGGKRFPPESKLMHINTLLLILVAIAGFLGNLIHIASSFTDYIGNGSYRKSWGLWYFVKPFTAAALAVAIYFVFRGGFLNMSDDSTNINLYGLMTISILAGLFTDRTTLKLKEVFDVLLKPKEERANPLEGDKPEITGLSAEPLEVDKPVEIILRGKNLDKKPLIVKIEGKEITSINKPDTITLTYTIPAELKEKESLLLEIVDDKATFRYSASLNIKKEVVNQESGEGGDGNPPGGGGGADDPGGNVGGGENAEEVDNQQEFGDADSDDNDINKPQE